MMYWKIGEIIFEEEQKGEEKAEFGAALIKSLADVLEPKYGTGFSSRQLELCRQFYRVFPKTNTLCSQFSWSHYKLLLPINNEDKNAILHS